MDRGERETTNITATKVHRSAVGTQRDRFQLNSHSWPCGFRYSLDYKELILARMELNFAVAYLGAELASISKMSLAEPRACPWVLSGGSNFGLPEKSRTLLME